MHQDYHKHLLNTTFIFWATTSCLLLMLSFITIVVLKCNHRLDRINQIASCYYETLVRIFLFDLYINLSIVYSQNNLLFILDKQTFLTFY